MVTQAFLLESIHLEPLMLNTHTPWRIRCTLILAAMAVDVSSADDHQLTRLPNIIILLADDLGYGELGCQGNPEIPTPHIDSMAKAGTRFTNAYVTAPFCSASRAGLITGRYQTRFGYEFNPIGAKNEDPQAGLPAGERTMAQMLHDRGYVTSLIGKWHLGGTASYHPIRRGFDEFFGFTHEGHYFVPPPYKGVTTMLRRRTLPGGGKGRFVRSDGQMIYSTHMGYDEPAYDANNPIVRGSQPVEEKEYLTDAFSREAVQFIERNKNHPFFLFLSYNAVHSPLQGAAKYMNRFAHIKNVHRRIFAAMLSNLDNSVGEVLGALKKHDLEQHTLIFFLSDNGGPTRELTSSNRPLRGEKGTVFEGGLRVPFIMQWPGRIPSGQISDVPITSLDIYATARRVSGDRSPKQKPLDGLNLVPQFGGSKIAAQRAFFWRIGQRRALREGPWKILQNGAGDWELYNLEKDISELNNLATQSPELAASLIKKWENYNRQMIDPIFSPRRRRSPRKQP